MAEQATSNLLQQKESAHAWAGQPAWRILATRFDRGEHFLNTWRAWQCDPCRPRQLHYVALASAPPSVDDLMACAAACPDLLVLAKALAPHWHGLAPGFHRITLAGGQILLTLCVGDLMAQLREQQFLADSVYLDLQALDPGAPSPWNIWTVKALARCCRRGTGLVAMGDTSALCADLAQCGFELLSGQTESLTDVADEPLCGQFNPRWALRNTRSPVSGQAAEVGTCAVVGAGLAGASVAYALAARSWQVQVLDQDDAPAAGASGLPVGLVVPHVSADDCALSRLSRSGVRMMLQQAQERLNQGLDWAPTGTLERRVDGTPDLPDLWHAQAAWIKPAQLVRAWLALPGITFQGGARVVALRRTGTQWELLDAVGQVLTRADRVVLANACGAIPLLKTLQQTQPELGVGVDQLPLMHGVRGQLSWAMHPGAPDAAFPPFPVNGAGSVIPVVPYTDASHEGNAWFVGSSFQPDYKPPSSDDKNHAANLGRLHRLLPALGSALAGQFAEGSVHAWKNTRCVTSDRLPVVGPLCQADDASLWICAGMGSRGLSFSVLCAELLAANWGAEPLPVDAALAQSLYALRARATAPVQYL